MEIFVSLRDSFIVFLMYLIGIFHLQLNNNIKIELVLYMCICMYVCLLVCMYFYRTIMISSMFLDLACQSIDIIKFCPDHARTLTKWCLPQSYHRFCNSYYTLDLTTIVVVRAVGSLVLQSCSLADPLWECREGVEG